MGWCRVPSRSVARSQGLLCSCGLEKGEPYFSDVDGARSIELIQRSANVLCVQAVAFLALLKHLDGDPGPHLLVAPASLLENWLREIRKWCPAFRVVLYHGNERAVQYEKLHRAAKGKGPAPFNVMLTCYSLFERQRLVNLVRSSGYPVLNLPVGRMLRKARPVEGGLHVLSGDLWRSQGSRKAECVHPLVRGPRSSTV